MGFDYTNSQFISINKRLRIYESSTFKIITYLCYILLILIFFVSIFDLLGGWLVSNLTQSWLCILFSLLSLFIIFETFIFSKLTKPQRLTKLSDAINNEKSNLADYLSNNLSQIIENCLAIAKKNQLAVITPELLLVGMKSDVECQWLLTRIGLVNDDDFEKIVLAGMGKTTQLGSIRYSNELIELINKSAKLACENQKEEIEASEVFLTLTQQSALAKRIIFELKIDEEDLQRIIVWQEQNKKIFAKKPFWEVRSSENLGANWVSGYTPTLNNFAYNLSGYLGNSLDQYYSSGQNQAITEMENILAKSGKNNVLIVGETGIGKKTIVRGFIRKVFQGEVAESVKFKHVFQLDVASILAGNKEIIESRIIKIFNEAAGAGNIILFIDGFADLTGGNREQVGTIDATTLFIPYLSSGSIRIIASCSNDDFKLKIEPNSSLKNLFEVIKVEEPKAEEVLNMLMGEKVLRIEFENNVFFSYQALKKIVELTDRYIHDKPFPEKAMEIAEEAAVFIKNQSSKYITPEIIEQIVSQKSKIPVAEAKEEEKETLLDLEALLHQRIIGQDEAISAISNTMRRARAGLTDKNRPMGSFLFLGPTGVGKTETAKGLAEAYFKSEKNIIRFDMSEFQEAKNVELLIGSSSVSKEAASQGRLTNAVKNNPYSLVLFDEIEKAHSNVLNLFLQVLDEGKLTDSAGRVVDFTNTIIIATSNAGAEKIRESLKQGLKSDDLKKTILEYLQTNGIFKPEFLNRFDSVICFKSLSIEEINQVAGLMINKLASELKEKDYQLEVKPEVISELAKLGYDPVMGARPMKRVIQEKIENMIAKKILSGQIQRGQKIEITLEDLK